VIFKIIPGLFGLTELRFYVPPDTKYAILDTFSPANLLA